MPFVGRETTWRPLNPSDIDELQALRCEALVSHPLAFGSSVEEDRTLDRALTLSTLASAAESATFGSFRAKQMVAMVSVYRESARKVRHRAQVWGMYVRSEDRRKGLGRALLAQRLLTHDLGPASSSFNFR